MRLKTILATLLFGAVCALSPMVWAQFHHHGGSGGMHAPMMWLMRAANLTPDQQAKVQGIMDANAAKAHALNQQLQAIHDQIADKLMSPGTVAVADLTPLQQQESQIHEQMGQLMLSSGVQVRNVLTPDQLAKVADLHSKLKAMRAQMQALIASSTTSAPASN